MPLSLARNLILACLLIERSRAGCGAFRLLEALRDGGYKAASSLPDLLQEDQLSMASERTLSIIKPDATRRNLTGSINAMIEAAGLRIIAQKRVKWDKAQAEAFYAVHRERPFFNDLVAFMTSGPIVLQVLEGDDAVARYRAVMGATNPADAAPDTIRKEFAESIEANSVHGSDSAENAQKEIAMCFSAAEIVG